MALEMLRAKLKIHSEFTQMAYVGGENAGGSAKADGIDGLEMVELPKS
jgi:hypothetical protein